MVLKLKNDLINFEKFCFILLYILDKKYKL